MDVNLIDRTLRLLREHEYCGRDGDGYSQCSSCDVYYNDKHKLGCEYIATISALETEQGHATEHQAEIDRIEKSHASIIESWKREETGWDEERAKMKVEIDRLRAALDEYGEHKATCAVYKRTKEQIDANQWSACTCGLDAALKEET
jgi:hypothetical protein